MKTILHLIGLIVCLFLLLALYVAVKTYAPEFEAASRGFLPLVALFIVVAIISELT